MKTLKTIKVTQSMREKVTADGMTVSIQLQATNKKYDAAVKKLQDDTAAAEKLLTAAGLQKGEIFASGARVGTERQDGKTQFCARTELCVTLPVADKRAGALMDALQESSLLWSQNYILLTDAHRKELLKRAVAAARDAAENIAVAAGVHLGTLAGVEYAADLGGAPRLMRAMAVAEPEQIETEETVTCEWEIQP